MWGYLKWLAIGLLLFGVMYLLFGSPGGLLWRTQEDIVPDGPTIQHEMASDIDSVCWTYGGGELGGSHVYTLLRGEDNTATLEVFEREEWDAPEETHAFGVDPSVLDTVDAMVSMYGLYDAQFNDGKNYVLDGDTWSLSITYEDGTRIVLEEYQDFTEDERAGIFGIRDVLRGLAEDVDM